MRPGAPQETRPALLENTSALQKVRRQLPLLQCPAPSLQPSCYSLHLWRLRLAKLRDFRQHREPLCLGSYIRTEQRQKKHVNMNRQYWDTVTGSGSPKADPCGPVRVCKPSRVEREQVGRGLSFG